MRRFGSSPETRAIAPAALQSAALGAILLASSFLALGWIFPDGDPYDLAFAAAILALVFGFVFGGLATALILMLAGVPIARLAGDRLESVSGTVIAMITALAGGAGFYVLVVENPFSSEAKAFFLLMPLCFALPAALIDRRQVLLERMFERA